MFRQGTNVGFVPPQLRRPWRWRSAPIVAPAGPWLTVGSADARSTLCLDDLVRSRPSSTGRRPPAFHCRAFSELNRRRRCSARSRGRGGVCVTRSASGEFSRARSRVRCACCVHYEKLRVARAQRDRHLDQLPVLTGLTNCRGSTGSSLLKELGFLSGSRFQLGFSRRKPSGPGRCVCSSMSAAPS